MIYKTGQKIGLFVEKQIYLGEYEKIDFFSRVFWSVTYPGTESFQSCTSNCQLTQFMVIT